MIFPSLFVHDACATPLDSETMCWPQRQQAKVSVTDFWREESSSCRATTSAGGDWLLSVWVWPSTTDWRHDLLEELAPREWLGEANFSVSFSSSPRVGRTSPLNSALLRLLNILAQLCSVIKVYFLLICHRGKLTVKPLMA